MNERIRQLAEQAMVTLPAAEGPLSHTYFDKEKFAELIIKECGVALSPMLRDMISRGQAYDLIKQYFGVEERKGWVCSKCGVDRTRDVCPKGHTAAITGDCPMTATAQTGVEE